MLDKADKAVIVDGKELAIGVHLTASLGQTRQLDLSVAIPLGWPDEEINATLDRVFAAANRQKDIQDLEATRALLRNAEQDLSNYRKQRVDTENGFLIAHSASQKRGEFKATGSQQKALDNLDINVTNSIERIKLLQKLIEELEGKCR